LKKTVLTGGPSGGKSTAADLLRREVGESIVVMSQVHKILYKDRLLRTGYVEASKAIQKEIIIQKSSCMISSNKETECLYLNG